MIMAQMLLIDKLVLQNSVTDWSLSLGFTSLLSWDIFVYRPHYVHPSFSICPSVLVNIMSIFREAGVKISIYCSSGNVKTRPLPSQSLLLYSATNLDMMTDETQTNTFWEQFGIAAPYMDFEQRKKNTEAPFPTAAVIIMSEEGNWKIWCVCLQSVYRGLHLCYTKWFNVAVTVSVTLTMAAIWQKRCVAHWLNISLQAYVKRKRSWRCGSMGTGTSSITT